MSTAGDQLRAFSERRHSSCSEGKHSRLTSETGHRCSGLQQRDEQPARAAGDLQCRSTAFGDLPLKECLVLVRLVAEPQIVALRREAAVLSVGRLHERGCYRTLAEHATRGGTKRETNFPTASLTSHDTPYGYRGNDHGQHLRWASSTLHRRAPMVRPAWPMIVHRG